MHSFLDTLLRTAHEQRASDIHLEPTATGGRIRLRVEGVLSLFTTFDTQYCGTIQRIIKVRAALDTAVTRLPQDGRCSFRAPSGEEIDIRVATFPTLHGEKIVLRLLEHATAKATLADLGFLPTQQVLLDRIPLVSQGVVLVTGPTGAGKTTTLHTILALCDHERLNCMTLEDPIEYVRPGIMQSAIAVQQNFSYAAAVKALMRQDPDIALIGEIRDVQTAHCVFDAALTGHLVLTTLHTTSALGAITRLMHMGVSRTILAAGLHMVIAQRLVGLLCSRCVYSRPLAEFERTALGGIAEGCEADGCDECRFTGRRGRTVVAEVLPISTELRQVIAAEGAAQSLADAVQHAGFVSLSTVLIEAVAAGRVSAREALSLVL